MLCCVVLQNAVVSKIVSKDGCSALPLAGKGPHLKAAVPDKLQDILRAAQLGDVAKSPLSIKVLVKHNVGGGKFMLCRQRLRT